MESNTPVHKKKKRANWEKARVGVNWPLKFCVVTVHWEHPLWARQRNVKFSVAMASERMLPELPFNCSLITICVLMVTFQIDYMLHKIRIISVYITVFDCTACQNIYWL